MSRLLLNLKLISWKRWINYFFRIVYIITFLDQEVIIIILGTHSLIAKIIYDHIFKTTGFMLDYAAFAYGNIKPDIENSKFKCDHTFEGSKHIVKAYTEMLTKKRLSVKEFSLNLGIVCHFICDYFCLQHSKAYWKRNPLAHGIYEIRLHAEFLSFYNNGINLRYICKAEDNIEDFIIKFRNKYSQDNKGMITDINYSLVAAIIISEWIVKSSRIYKEYNSNPIGP